MMTDPTPAEVEMGSLVQTEVIELVNRLTKEGLPPAVVLAGIASGAAATVQRFAGPDQVMPWFAAQAALAMQFRG